MSSQNKTMHIKAYKKSKIYWLISFLCFVSSFVYYKIMHIAQENIVSSDALYFQSELFDCFVLINSFLLIPIIVYGKKIITIIKKKKTLFVLISVYVMVLFTPLFFIKNGIYADSKYIKELGLFGNEKQVYTYNEINEVNITLKRGIQYDITFYDDNNIFIASHTNLVKPFKNDQNLVSFDKLISNNSNQQNVFLPVNSKWYVRFLTTVEAKDYFLEKSAKSRVN